VLLMVVVRCWRLSGGISGTLGGSPAGLDDMALVYLVQHGDRERLPGDPGLTARGRHQAALTAHWLRNAGVRALYSSPLRRAQETADIIAAVTGLPIQPDARLCERNNWEGNWPYENFLADWARATRDRDFVPHGGESSRQAGDRLHGFVAALPAGLAPAAVVSHGGVTTDLLRNLLPDQQLPAGLLETGIPPCAITTLEDLAVVSIAATGHLHE
jgi:broad specificity phosphatase PhoE